MRMRRPVAVLLSRFPLVTETFILREIDEMERQGQPVRLVPLLRETPRILHREADPWVRRALYTPYLSPPIVAANLRALLGRPRAYFALLGRVLRGNLPSPGFLLRSLALFPKCVYLAERLEREGIGHVHAHFATHPALAALVISSLTGIGYSLTVHAHDLFVERAFLRAKLKGARFVRAISRFNRQVLRERYPEIGEEKLPVIHVGIDCEPYSGARPTSASPPLVLCVAAIKPYKGLPVLLQACRRLRDEGVALRCDLVGEGPARRAIESGIAALGLEEVVRLRGAQRQDEVAGLMREAALVVLPSVVAADGQMEGIPVTLMEAMASRRAVVASSLSGIPELVEDGVCGLLVPPGDALALAGAIRRLLEDPGLARRMGQSGREKVEREFGLAECVSGLVARIDAESTPLDAGLAERLEAFPWCADGASACALGVRRVHERPESTVAELLGSDGRRGRDLVFKVQRTPPAAESARREYQALRLLHGVFSPHPGFGVPRPLRLDGTTVLMEPCRGRPLDAIVREARRAPARQAPLDSALRRTGRWLRLLQEGTAGDGSAREALEALLARARRDIETCVGRGLSRRAARAIAERLDPLAAAIAPRALRLVGHHADFWPGNVFVEEERVEVIDFEGFGRGLPYEDAAYFLVELELFYAYPLLHRSFRARAAAFLEGYLASAGLDAAGFELSRRAKALQILAQGLGGDPASSPLGGRQRRALAAIACGAWS